MKEELWKKGEGISSSKKKVEIANRKGHNVVKLCSTYAIFEHMLLRIIETLCIYLHSYFGNPQSNLNKWLSLMLPRVTVKPVGVRLVKNVWKWNVADTNQTPF